MASVTSNIKTSRRLKPCLRCKIQRRKCDRASEIAPCFRCIKSKRECINDDGQTEPEDDSIDGNVELAKLTAQVAALQENLYLMESRLQYDSVKHSPSVTTPKAPTSDSVIPYDFCSSIESTCTYKNIENSTFSVYIDHNNVTSLLPSASSLSPSSSTSSVSGMSMTDISTTTTDNNDEYQWDLTLVNGRLQLQSPIQSFDELMAYGHALQRYLSPFAGVFDNTAFLFEVQPASLIPMVIQVMDHSSKSLLKKESRKNVNLMSKYHFLLQQQHPGVLLASIGKEPPVSIIDELVNIYFSCFNPALPLVHAPSYMAEYQESIRKNPYQHIITMAMLCSICASPCRHMHYNNFERRILADFFYQKAIELLCDTFDEPEHRLQTLMTINLLSQYQRANLLVNDARKWSSIGYMVAKDLEQEYKYHQSVSALSPKLADAPSPASTSTWTSSSTTTPSTSTSSHKSPPPPDHTFPTVTSSSSGPETLYMADIAPSTKDIDYAMFGRHYIINLASHAFLALLLDHNPATWEFLKSKPVFYIEGESEVSYTFIGLYNKALQFISHPIVLELNEQIQRMQLGEVAKVTLELILRFDQVYKDWWGSLPKHFRLCEQLPSETSCRPLIEKCTSQIQLIVFMIAVSHKAEANLALIKPSNQASISQGGDYALVRAIQERALNEAYECTESMTIAMTRLESRKMYCIFGSDIMIHIADLLSNLASSSNASVKDRARQRLNSTLVALRQSKMMEGNLVPPSMSPLKSMNVTPMATATSSSSPTNSEFANSVPPSAPSNEIPNSILDMYHEYATPVLAFGYDILMKASESD